MVPHFADAFQFVMVREYAEHGPAKVSSEAFETRDDAAGLQIKRSPLTLRVERSSAGIRDGFHGTVRLLLFEGCAKLVDARVAVHVERT